MHYSEWIDTGMKCLSGYIKKESQYNTPKYLVWLGSSDNIFVTVWFGVCQYESESLLSTLCPWLLGLKQTERTWSPLVQDRSRKLGRQIDKKLSTTALRLFSDRWLSDRLLSDRTYPDHNNNPDQSIDVYMSPDLHFPRIDEFYSYIPGRN